MTLCLSNRYSCHRYSNKLYYDRFERIDSTVYLWMEQWLCQARDRSLFFRSDYRYYFIQSRYRRWEVRKGALTIRDNSNDPRHNIRTRISGQQLRWDSFHATCNSCSRRKNISKRNRKRRTENMTTGWPINSEMKIYIHRLNRWIYSFFRIKRFDRIGMHRSRHKARSSNTFMSSIFWQLREHRIRHIRSTIWRWIRWRHYDSIRNNNPRSRYAIRKFDYSIRSRTWHKWI